MSIKAVLLAAGESSRFWPLAEKRHKSTIKICGKPIILWTMESLAKAGIRDFAIVQSARRDVERTLGEYDLSGYSVNFVLQEKALGMGDAVERVKDFVEDYFLVLNPNYFNAHEFVLPMSKKLRQARCDAVLLGKHTGEPWNYGVFEFKNGKAIGIAEKPERGREPSKVRALGIYLLSKKFFDYHARVKKHEYSFEDALSLLLKKEGGEVIITEKDTVSLKYPWHLLDFTRKLMECWIEKPRISENAKISEKACIEGNVVVERDVRVFEHACIKGPCYIGESSVVGNNAIVRQSHLGKECIAGANSEIARSVFLDDAHVHSGYFGDSILAEHVRAGAGTVTANVRLDRGEVKSTVKGERVPTGKASFGAVIGEHTKLGINCSLMPGVLIGSNCVIGPCTLVRENIPSGTLFYFEFKAVKRVKNNGNQGNRF